MLHSILISYLFLQLPFIMNDGNASLTVIPNAVSATDRLAENQVLRCPRFSGNSCDHVRFGGMELCCR